MVNKGFYWLLVVSFALFKGVNAVPAAYKMMVELNLSAPLPKRIKGIYSLEVPGGINYTIKPGSRHTHIIGRVTESSNVVVEGDPRYMSRYVLVVPRCDDSKYIRVVSRHRTGNNYITTIKEFIKRSQDLSYFQIFRTAFEIDITTQETTNIVNVRVSISSDQTGDSAEVRHFCVQDTAQDEVVIGTIKYGDQLVDDKVDGLILREVTWEGGFSKPKITVFSRYNDGTEAKYKYTFMNEDSRRFFIFEETKGLMNLYT